jgi:hypothetical protein
MGSSIFLVKTNNFVPFRSLSHLSLCEAYKGHCARNTILICYIGYDAK